VAQPVNKADAEKAAATAGLHCIMKLMNF